MLRVGLHKSVGLVSTLIKWQSRSVYSHASLILPDDTILESMQGQGVVHNRSLISCADTTDVCEVVGLASVHAAAQRFAEAQLGKPYDYTMVARFVSRRPETRKSSGKWFCSELVFASFASAGLPLLRDTEAWEVSPGLLAKSPYLVPVTESMREAA